MKIINLEEFKKMPVGTIFAKYEPCNFQGLMCLQGHSENDFCYDPLLENIDNEDSGDFVDKCTEMENDGSCELDFNYTERDGDFNKNQLFAIYEKQDIIDFIYKLENSLIDSHGIGLKDL